jgi:hypothetical protein
MNATVLDRPVETQGTAISCENCPALQRLERALTQLQADCRREVGYWKSRHTDAVRRIGQLKEELDQARGQVRSLQDKLFGRKSEKSSRRDRSNALLDPEAITAPAKKRGAQPGHTGHGRRDYSHLPVEEEFISLPAEMSACGICGRPFVMMSDTEDSELLEIQVRAHRRRIRRRRYRTACDCDCSRRTLTAPLPPKLIPKGNYGISIWVHVLLDKYSSYRPTERLLGQLEQQDLDLVLAFCWAHVRRDFVGVGKGWSELTPWALSWLRRIRHIYQLNRQRLCHQPGSARFQEREASLHAAVEQMRAEAVEELADPKLRQPCRKVLESLQEHWAGLVRFVDDPRVPMDNNASERAGRGPAVARKNFYGSGSLWSGRLAVAMFSLLATLAHWKLNPRRWLTWYLESCAAAGGKAPENIEPFLPWNLSEQRREALAKRTPTPAIIDTS